MTNFLEWKHEKSCDNRSQTARMRVRELNKIGILSNNKRTQGLTKR